MPPPLIILPTPYDLTPTDAEDGFCVTMNGEPLCTISGAWAKRMYALHMSGGYPLNCYQGSNYVLTGSNEFDGVLHNEMREQGDPLSYNEAITAFDIPMGVQWLTKNSDNRERDNELDHLHSAVLIAAGPEEEALVFEIPGYGYKARIATLAEVHAREMAKTNAYQTVTRHFYNEKK